MKANGKNLMMFTFQTHHYMDMQPEVEFMTRESQNDTTVVITMLILWMIPVLMMLYAFVA